MKESWLAFMVRWMAAVATAFILYPVGFVLWYGPDGDWGFVGGIVIMFFLQFISPYDLWRVPLAAGSVAGLVWYAIASRKLRSRPE